MRAPGWRVRAGARAEQSPRSAGAGAASMATGVSRQPVLHPWGMPVPRHTGAQRSDANAHQPASRFRPGARSSPTLRGRAWTSSRFRSRGMAAAPRPQPFRRRVGCIRGRGRGAGAGAGSGCGPAPVLPPAAGDHSSHRLDRRGPEPWLYVGVEPVGVTRDVGREGPTRRQVAGGDDDADVCHPGDDPPRECPHCLRSGSSDPSGQLMPDRHAELENGG